MVRLSEFFDRANKRDIVINSDIDGFLSGMILQKYYNCRVVGFSNSKESIWISPEISSIYEPVYIDIFVNNANTFCIDQHIVAYDTPHLERIVAYGTKLNPNLNVLKKTYKNDYYHKYPFGTVHYLIALMALDGIEVEINELEQEFVVLGADFRQYRISPGQIILRADDALYSSLGKYADNASDWWNQLKNFNSTTIDSLYDYVYKSCKKSQNQRYKDNMRDFFIRGLGCDGADGAFNNIVRSDGKTLESRVIYYNQVINEIVGINMDLPTEVNQYKGTAFRGAYSPHRLQGAVTYAFVFGPTKPSESFSYTIDIG